MNDHLSIEATCYVLILNYCSYQDTINYVKILKKQKSIILKILIVDNFSENDSFSILLNYFKDSEDVEVIQSAKNGGYAYGNNFGLRYLANIKVDYILVSNNDIQIDDELLLFNLINKYQQLNRPAFAAPVMRVNGVKSKYAAWKIPTLKDDLVGSLGTLEKVFGNRTVYVIDDKDDAMPVDCLPGSFFIAKKEVFFDIGLMDEGTFLYMEEVILATKIRNVNLVNYLIKSLVYDHATSKTISSKFSSIQMRCHLINSRTYFHRTYLKTGKLGIGLLIILFHLWKVENYIYKNIFQNLNNYLKA